MRIISHASARHASASSKKKVGGHADAQLLAAFHLVIPRAVAAQRVAEARLRAVDLRAVFAALAVQKIHVAVRAALAALDAPVPRIPNVVHRTSPPFPRSPPAATFIACRPAHAATT